MKVAMGVMIFLDIMPKYISDSDWEQVYEESLEIINAYPFLDSIFDDQTYDINWKYLTHTEERALNFSDNKIGWHTIGDEQTFKSAESFILRRKLENYLSELRVAGNCDDILFSRTRNTPIEGLEVGTVSVFDSKTQGEPYHIPLLSISCLIESRFPKHAIVYGDVTLGQMEKAVEWANSILKKPIELTERADNEKLLKRIKSVVLDEYAALETLMTTTLKEEDLALGELVRKEFGFETIDEYFITQFKNQKLGTLGFHSEFTSYMNQGYELERACELCVLDLNGCNYDAEKFVKKVLSMTWSENKEDDMTDTLPTKINNPNSATPETVYSMLGKSFFKMAGVEESVKNRLSFEEVVQILQRKLGHLCEVDALVKKRDEEERKDNLDMAELFASFPNLFESEREGIEYTINQEEDLIQWKLGDTIHPNLEEGIMRVKELVEESLNEEDEFITSFKNMTKRDKMRQLIHSNRYFYIHKNVWDDIWRNSDDEEMMIKVLTVLSVKADTMMVNHFCKGLLNNQALFKHYL